MRRIGLAAVILVALIGAGHRTTNAQNPEGIPSSAVRGTVAEHIDGDKVMVDVRSAEEEVLLAGVDAPEEGECFHEESSNRVAELIPVGTAVYLEASGDDRDGSDRLIRYVWIPGEDGEKAILLNTKLVRDGYAGYDDSKDTPKYFENLEKAEASARDGDKGLWGECGELHTEAVIADEPADEEEEDEESRCLPVDQTMVDAIATGLEPGLTLRAAHAVRSEDFEEVYFIAIEIEGPGFEGDDQIGVWASNSLEAGGGLIMAVDGLAEEFSDWGHGADTDAELGIGDDGVDEAIDCVDDAL